MCKKKAYIHLHTMTAQQRWCSTEMVMEVYQEKLISTCIPSLPNKGGAALKR